MYGKVLLLKCLYNLLSMDIWFLCDFYRPIYPRSHKIFLRWKGFMHGKSWAALRCVLRGFGVELKWGRLEAEMAALPPPPHHCKRSSGRTFYAMCHSHYSQANGCWLWPMAAGCEWRTEIKHRPCPSLEMDGNEQTQLLESCSVCPQAWSYTVESSPVDLRWLRPRRESPLL